MKQISELPTGEKIVDTIMFRGMLFAATHDGVFYLDGQDWKRLELTPEPTRQLPRRLDQSWSA